MKKAYNHILHWLVLFIFVFIVSVFILVFYQDNNDYNFSSIKHQLIEPPVSLIAVGDVMLSRDVDSTMKRRSGYDYPFIEVKDYLQQGDIVFANLEAPITPGRAIATEEMVFRADPEVAAVLKDVGFNILSLANNHILNFGQTGLQDTYTYLDEQEIQYCGTQTSNPAIVEKNKLKFAFLAYTYNSMNISEMQSQVADIVEEVEYVIISMHAGNEYAAVASKQQKDFAHAAVDAGAELVLGHHPHVTQPIEKYNDKYIFYSLGNFVFDQMWSEETKKGLIANITFDSSGVTHVELRSAYIEDFAQPRFKSQANSVFARLKLDDIDSDIFSIIEN